MLAELEIYAERNTLIHAILEAPRNSVQLLAAWPRAFRAVWGSEMETFVILKALIALNESMGPQDPAIGD
jgi:hypothetical protein